MSKKQITYTDLVKVMLTKAREDAASLGSKFDPKKAFSMAASRWKKVKQGSDTEFAPGSKKTKPVPAKKSKTKKSKTRKKRKTRNKK